MQGNSSHVRNGKCFPEQDFPAMSKNRRNHDITSAIHPPLFLLEGVALDLVKDFSFCLFTKNHAYRLALADHRKAL